MTHVSTSPASVRDALRDDRGQPLVHVAARRARALRRARSRALRGARPQPDRAHRRALRRGARARARRPSISSASSACSRRVDAEAQRRTWWERRERGRPVRRRVLLVRVRARREPPDLLGRPRRARRRPPEVGVRPRRPARRRRPLLPRGLLPPAARRGRLAGRALSRERPRAAAAHARAGERRSSSSPTSSGALVPGARRRSGARRSGACRSTCSTRTSTATPTGRGRSPTSSTAATASTGSGRSSCSASAACARSAALGLEPTVFHMNEGHSAFLQLERLRELVEDEHLPRDAALQRLRASTVFTTHTPGAGRATRSSTPRSSSGTSGRSSRAAASRGTSSSRSAASSADETGFGLTPFALRTSSLRERRVRAARRGLARDVARPLAGAPGRRGADRLGHERRARAHLDRRRRSTRCSATRRTWARPTSPARTSSTTRRSGARTARRSDELLRFMRSRGLPASFDPDALTIGFARRFATYKRADLLFSDPDRLARLLADAERPLQIVLAGKAHPADEGGKALIQQVVEFAREPAARTAASSSSRLRHDARALPRAGRRRVAEHPAAPARGVGTSGHEGGAERRRQLSRSSTAGGSRATRPTTGFAIGGDWVAANDAAQDAADAEALFAVLEEQVHSGLLRPRRRGLPAGSD